MPAVIRLDLYTLGVATVANLLMTSAAMFVFWKLNGRLRDVKSYCVANLLISFGFLVLMGGSDWRGATLAANLSLFAGALLILNSIRSVRILRRAPAWLVMPAVLFYAAIMAYWLFVRDDMTARAAAASPFFVIVSVCSAVSLAIHVPKEERAVYWSTAGFFSLHSLSLTIRTIRALNGDLGEDQFATRVLDLMSLTTLNLAITGSSFGLCAVMNMKVRREAERLACYDLLTGLPNRRFFDSRLAGAMELARRSGGSLALVYCDIDRFKQINDSHGHEVGDSALRAVAGRLAANVGLEGLVARVGGDEFLIVLERARTAAEALRMVERLRLAARQEIPVAGTRLVLEISCGFAMFPDDADSAEGLIREADARMYTAKNRCLKEGTACTKV